ncbi:transmembrane protease serine 9-like [Diachasmimorpha longicaudata]|uniref:transmembrane protease serine 9-like n=1 Tax=Diachasmimorpha longicaudata TaxID=58733 RepID=UPI0030B881AC
MTGLTLIFVALAIVSVANGKPPQRIVGGTLASRGEIPYIVSLNRNGHHFCGGSIISDRHILTAAHCVHDFTSSTQRSVTIRAGSLTSRSGGQTYTVDKIQVHPEYVDHLGSPPNDIAIIKVKETIKFDQNTKKIDLVTSEPKADASVVVSGWGLRSARSRQTPADLYTVTVKVVSPTTCRRSYPRSMKDTHVCAYGSVGHGVCMGDSGGPLALNGRLAGLVSFGLPCAVGHPDVYTSVYHYRTWIRNTMVVAVAKLCLFAIISQTAIAAAVGDIETRQKIVGGVDADDGEYPFLVAIHSGDGFCSGSIISRNYVLTAAHCVNSLNVSDIPDISVRTGNVRSRTYGGKIYRVDAIAIHKGFENHGNFPHDIAIMKLKKLIKFNRYTEPISLSESVPRASNKITVIGWGRIAPSNSTSPVKPQVIDEIVLSRKKCAKIHGPDPITKSHICVRGSKRLGICNGDSGGPALFNNALVGITSFSGPSCARGEPDVFTSIPYHLAWIDQTIAKMETLSSQHFTSYSFSDYVIYKLPSQHSLIIVTVDVRKIVKTNDPRRHIESNWANLMHVTFSLTMHASELFTRIKKSSLVALFYLATVPISDYSVDVYVTIVMMLGNFEKPEQLSSQYAISDHQIRIDEFWSYGSEHEKIIGGVGAEEGDFPFLVSLSRYGKHFCGGSIITEVHILTAAHCIARVRRSQLRHVQVRTGSLNWGKRGTLHHVDSVRLFPGYGRRGGFRHDIAIIKLKSPMRFDRYTTRIQLSKSTPPAWSQVTVAGWGKYGPSGRSIPQTQQTADFVAIPRAKCRRSYGWKIDENHICIKANQGVGVCFGDSGGPLISHDRLVGVASFIGGKCGYSGRPDVFASVPHHFEWINKVINE